MQQLFTSWYAGMSFQVEPEAIQKRWAAVNAISKTPTKEVLSLMTKLAFHLKVNMTSSEVSTLRASLAAGGTTPGDEELHLLAAAALYVATDPEAVKTLPLPAMLVACASCAGLRPLEQPMNLVAQSESALQKLADTKRRRPSLDQGRILTVTTETPDTVTQKAINEENWPAAFKGLFAIANKAIAKMAARQNQFELATQEYLTVQDEELDILWWLHGGHSFHAQADFPQVPSEERPLSMAYELASLTKVLPGPPSAPALLTRTGVTAAPKSTIPAAVQAMPLSWLQRVAESVDASKVTPSITPIHFAIARRHEAEGKDDWIGPWSTATGIAQDAGLDPLQISLAAYREFILVKLGK